MKFPILKAVTDTLLTREVATKGQNKFKSPAGRIDCLIAALMYPFFAALSPLCVAYECKKEFKLNRKINPLDVFVSLLVAPIFFSLATVRTLLGAIIHPGIVYRAKRPRSPTVNLLDSPTRTTTGLQPEPART